MRQPLGYSSDGDLVTLTMVADDYSSLLLALGMAAVAIRDGDKLNWVFIALANRLNVGNPNWTPYAVDEHGKSV